METNLLKKIILSVLLGIIFIMPCKILGQFNSEAPWMKNVSKEGRVNQFTFNTIVSDFDAYWSKHDKTKKGSGYKPFKRWENHWKNDVHKGGNLITPGEMLNEWDKKVKARSISSKTSNWQPVGPYSYNLTNSWSAGQGRVNMIYVDPNNSNFLYVGTPAGGIWKSTNAGSSWKPMSDELPQIGVSGIVTDPKNSNIIYIATGDKDATDTYSIGVLKSIDGGVTWHTTGLVFSNGYTRASEILIHPTNSNVLWVATSEGLFKTIDAGGSWTKILDQNVKDIKLKPGNPNTIYAVTPSNFYRSTNGGTSFSKVVSGLPITSSRLVIDVTPANSSYVYVLSANDSNGFQGLYRSTNSGVSFVKTASTTDIFESTQSWYDLAIAVSDKDPNLVFTGCLNVWKTKDGGTTFNKVSEWSSPSSPSYTHADIHFLRFYNNKLYCGSDGGIYVSSNEGDTFSSLTNGLQIGQFYSIAVSKQSSNKMSGGLQDNGGYVLNNDSWNVYVGADGMETVVDPNDSNKYYNFIQSGLSLYSTHDAGKTTALVVSKPEAENGNWVTPLAINSLGEVFSGYSRVYKLDGAVWNKVGQTDFLSNVSDLKIDPSNDNIMYATDVHKLYKSIDKGVTFQLLYIFPEVITDITVHSSNGAILYVVTSSTSGLVYKSIDSGATFTELKNGLPNVGKNVIVHQAFNSLNPLYLGTTLGVYYKDDSMSAWQPFDTNLPNVSITDLEINYVDNFIIAATYGRGIWKAPITPTIDTQAPSVPTNIIASGTTPSTTNLSWTAATDNIGVTGYDIYQGTSLIGTVNTTTYTVTGLNPSTTYSFTIKAKDAAGNISVASTALNVTTLPLLLDYCNSKGNSTTYEYIQKVQIGTINNVSTSSNGYSDFTNVSTDLIKENSYNIIITPKWSNSIYSEGYTVWIDYNGDRDFDDIGETVLIKSPSTTTPVSGSFTIPTTAINGPTRMRVAMKYEASPLQCESFPYGEVEDYTVNIINSSTDTQAPTAPSYLINTNTSSSSTSLSWNSSIDNVGVTGYDVYQGTNLIATVFGRSYTVTGLLDAMVYSFSVRARDAAGNISAPSNILEVTTLTKYCQSKGNDVVDEYIDYVGIGGIANTTGANAGYGDFRNLIGNVFHGVNNITFSAGFRSSAYNEFWSIWIDYDKNGVFEPSERVVNASSSSAAILSATFNIPVTVLPGPTRMRVQMKYNETSTPCELFPYGEVEDYTINIQAPSNQLPKINSDTTEDIDFVMYPNPVDDLINISSSINSNDSYKIFNLQGLQLQLGKMSKQIDVSYLSSGIYILELHTKHKTIAKKFLKK